MPGTQPCRVDAARPKKFEKKLDKVGAFQYSLSQGKGATGTLKDFKQYFNSTGEKLCQPPAF